MIPAEDDGLSRAAPQGCRRMLRVLRIATLFPPRIQRECAADSVASGAASERSRRSTQPAHAMERKVGQRLNQKKRGGQKASWYVMPSAVVDNAGWDRNIGVANSLRMGPDKKTVESVRQWKFTSATKDGK
jgi:hypothetical protein